jgi:hypothetical protein
MRLGAASILFQLCDFRIQGLRDAGGTTLVRNALDPQHTNLIVHNQCEYVIRFDRLAWFFNTFTIDADVATFNERLRA